MRNSTARLLAAAIVGLSARANFEWEFDSIPERPDIENLKKQKKSKAQWKAEKGRTTFRKG